ncbi:hypothetical protein [Corynebacterium sp. HS2168-gen11]|uniref:hypothetical protein n=1 Tax=Corynebacterium sp. HS2168-gen11 TaxID=2974027 RepID=UPI00216B352F|nr:hypothetical protein [Corynebacterium sp. HS2168-gen11]MCS4535619.1 hypothetical protein [Corynebacterium sp. HS2168-gen11]
MKSSNIFNKSLISFGLAILLLFSVVEVGARYVVHKKMVAAVAEHMPAEILEDTTIAFGLRPITPSLLLGKMNYVRATVPIPLNLSDSGEQASEVDPPNLYAVLRGVPLKEDPNALLDKASLETTLPKEYIQTALQAVVQGLSSEGSFWGTELFSPEFLISEVRTHPDEGTLEIVFGEELASIVVHPQSIDGKLKMVVEDTSLFGTGIPKPVARFFTKWFEGIEDAIPDELTVTTAEVTKAGLHIELERTNIPWGQFLSEPLESRD